MVPARRVKFTFSNLPGLAWHEPVGRIVDLARVCEEVGFDRYGVSDWRFMSDCIVTMTACLQGTRMLGIQSQVTDPYVRHPTLTAAAHATMDDLAKYDHVASEVAAELAAGAAKAEQGGIARERIVLDPGFGFAKTATHNFRLLDELATIVALGYPVAVGLSRKRFLGAATGRPVGDRDRATAVACALAWERGARLFRVHDVALTREALALASATTNPP